MYATIMELGPKALKDHPYYGFGELNSKIVVYMDPLGMLHRS